MSRLVQLLRDDFLAQADAGMRLMVSVGADRALIPAGHNGPHYALETPVRNTCHWLTAFLIAYRLTSDIRFRQSAISLRNWLLDGNVHFRRGVFVMRQSLGSDWCNGVIGPAWVIEALARLSDIEDKQACSFLRDYISRHRFDVHSRAWIRDDPGRRKRGIDGTLDHQAWMAAALADAGERETVGSFLDGLHAGGLHLDGNRIRHILMFGGIKGWAVRTMYHRACLSRPSHMAEIEEGYHIYTMLPLVRLRARHPGHPFFASDAWGRACGWLTTASIERCFTSRYGAGYNAPGLELPAVWMACPGEIPLVEDDVIEVWRRQRERTFDAATGLHTKGCPDAVTLASRAYELGLGLETTRGA